MCATSCDFCAEQSETSSCQSVKNLCNCDSLFVIKLAKKIKVSDTIPAENTTEIALPDTSVQDCTPEINYLDTAHAISKNISEKNSTKQNMIAEENADSISTDFITRAYSKKMHRGILVDFSLNSIKLGSDSYWSNTAFSINLGYFKRFYFYKYGSIQWGLGLNYDLGQGDFTYGSDYGCGYGCGYGISWYYNKIGLFAPFTLRIGVPFFFISGSLVLKKSVYELIVTEEESIGVTGDFHYHDPWSNSDIYYEYGGTLPEKRVEGISSLLDWQSLFLFGVGFDIFRRVTLEVQFGTGLSTGLFENIEYNSLKNLGIIRFNVEYLW